MLSALIGITALLGLSVLINAYGQQDDVITVNATVPVKLRFSPALIPVNPTGTESQTPVIVNPNQPNQQFLTGVNNPTTAPSIPPITVGGQDITGILTGLIAAVTSTTGGIGAYLFKRRKTVEKRDNVVADTVEDAATSIKETDYSVRKLTHLVAKLAESHPDENLKQEAKAEAESWDKDIRKYYETSETNDCELSNDKVVKKMGIVKKNLRPTDLPEE